MCQRRLATARQAYVSNGKIFQVGTVALMNDKNIKPCTLLGGTQDSPNAEMQQLVQIDGMQMEIDILKKTINV